MQVVKKPVSKEVDYAELDKPTVIRKRAVGENYGASSSDEDYLDIPAFLRRQAD